MDKEKNNTTGQEKPANISTANEISLDADPYFWDWSIKELMAKEEVQKAILSYVHPPKEVTIKKLRKPFTNDETKTTTQKAEVMSGTTIEDAVSFELTLLGTGLDPVKAINKKYHIIDYSFALEANMNAGKFGGYAAKGLKLIVTKLEEVR